MKTSKERVKVMQLQVANESAKLVYKREDNGVIKEIKVEKMKRIIGI